MKITLSLSQFLKNWPESREDQFTYEGKKGLFEFVEEYEEATGDEQEFDPIALCCDFTEYDSLEEVKANYNNIQTLEQLEEKTQVRVLENGHLLVQNF